MGALERIVAATLGLLIGGVAFWAAFRFLKARSILKRWHTVTGMVVKRGTFVPNEPDLSTLFFP